MSLSKKVILIGHFGVGKSSLVQRFVHQKFSDQYITTIGVKIDKKVVQVDGFDVTMIIWDIAGEDSQKKVPVSYRLGAHGALYVFDLSRPSTYENLQSELDYLNQVIPGIPVQILANKMDLVNDTEREDILDSLSLEEVLETSAKTGLHVEEAFQRLAKKMV
ncbi:Rab family GTPase [Roseivirga sp. E12]|uniref:Rab family GTPase n=1 Tax=Roseivirga sp. E12 TaxID=2819237 RepID=UPI001ABC6A11|nr:Rab family GTPase [Roseivirga sp. E12]MBO3698812.1 GTP-binding protein [Roseivirga sp. E12]